jgi:hypothetical protein
MPAWLICVRGEPRIPFSKDAALRTEQISVGKLN